ncbi:hypothetical protein FB45DRAFT_909873 [Roridomyces roridus]|uniref:Uncharacterized protein n=1 Tax=Roridomyces roridus TaxID=1738132 RepID=A0AAD7FR94_9AGAR|nr:hypothetical protein FB45DRAFT_909873 [Roridomyces roridus]
MTDDGDMKGKESKVVPPVVGSGVGIPMTDDGDMKGKESEIIPPVVGSTAREIPATEFSVSSNLITKVEELWSESFHQKHVRAEPYKIHLYGPGAPLHKADNGPETDFVGRFFVGLGERIYDGRYSIPLLKVKKVGGWDKNHAYPGWWVAFYADVDYSIPEIKRGYAAVIEFKIFQQHLEVPEESADVVLRGKLENVLMKLPVPYGILLHHHYPGGTEDLFGLDALMYAAAGATGDAKLLPVQIRWTNSRWGDGKANVYPMTDDHLETILTHLETRTLEQACAEDFYEHRRSMGTKLELFVDLKGTEAEWIHHHQSPQPIPFYSPDFPATAIPWKLSEVYDTDTSGARGHRPCNEESIYLSYAVVVVPKRGVKRAAEEEEPSAE